MFFWIFYWNWFKHPIERWVQAATGREFTINGDLRGHLGLVPVSRDFAGDAPAKPNTKKTGSPRATE